MVNTPLFYPSVLYEKQMNQEEEIAADVQTGS